MTSDPEPTAKAPIVFVVDDDAEVRESIETLIRVAGWQVETFDSARAFLARPRTLLAEKLTRGPHRAQGQARRGDDLAVTHAAQLETAASSAAQSAYPCR